MVANTAMSVLSKTSQQAFIQYYRSIQNSQNTCRMRERSRLERADREYMREMDYSIENLRAKRANAAGDPSRFQNMTVPVVMPQVEAAVTHQASVFLTGIPILGVVAGPEFMDSAKQLETVLDNNSVRGGWVRELMMSFRDGFKYNFAPLEVTWGQEVTYTVETDIKKNLKEGVPKQVIWSGNKLVRWDPYNTFVDNRVTPTEVYKHGEYAGKTELFTRMRLKSFISELPIHVIANVVPAFESGLGGSVGAQDAGAMNYYEPLINPDLANEVYPKGDMNWLSWAGFSKISKRTINYKSMYEVTTLYCRILPAEMDLRIPNNNTPQVFKLIIVNHEHIIYAERQTNAHGYLPVMISSPLEDGLKYQTKSLAENSAPFQNLTTSYMASILAGKRRAINDRCLYDPSRITEAHINSANPSAKIPVRPAAFGKTLSDAVYQFPYRNDQNANDMQQVQVLLGLSNTLAGQNSAQQGQFQKGNRTLHEFESVMQNANGRNMLTSMLLESQLFTPTKEILKLNTLQYQGGTTIYNREKKTSVEIDPVQLRKAVLEFKVTDGLVPADKVLNSDTFAVALQVFGSSPQIAAGYNIGPFFSYMMKTQGSEIDAFEKSQEQVAYEQAVAQWSQLATFAIEKEQPFDIPQPLPEQFGYNPQQNTPAPKDESRSGNLDTPPGAPPTNQ